MDAEKLILCTGAPGILERLDDPTRSSLTRRGRAAPLARRRRPLRRHAAQVRARSIGYPRRRAARARHLLRAPDALLAEIFTNEGTGTLVVADTKALSARNRGQVTRLWTRRAARRARAALHRREDHALDNRLVAYDVQPRSHTPKCCTTLAS